MLTLNQILLIQRIEFYINSPFSVPVTYSNGKECYNYLATEEEFSDFLSIPSSSLSHLKNVNVQTHIAASESVRHLDFITSQLSNELDFSPIDRSGDVVTPPL